MLKLELNEDLASPYSKNSLSFATITSETQLPAVGLNAGNLLDPRQMNKLREIRTRRLKSDQIARFLKD